MSKKRIDIKDIPPLKESYQVPEGYFEYLKGKIEDGKNLEVKEIQIEKIPLLKESFQVPEGYFEGLMDKIEERKKLENNVVAFRSRRIKIWGSFVAAACTALVIISVVNWGGNQPPPTAFNEGTYQLKISDHEVASLLDDRDDEFELTEDEIVEAIEHETQKSESTAIINYLEEENDLGVSEDEDFLETI